MLHNIDVQAVVPDWGLMVSFSYGRHDVMSPDLCDSAGQGTGVIFLLFRALFKIFYFETTLFIYEIFSYFLNIFELEDSFKMMIS